jgi:hypothetical protein
MSGGLSIYAAENFISTNTTATYVTISTTQSGTTPTLGGAERMRVTQDGNVGIGTTAPTQRLHVEGSMRLNDGSQGSDKVLVSDADGNATWAKNKPTVGNASARLSTSQTTSSTSLTSVGSLSISLPVEAGDLVMVQLACNLFISNSAYDASINTSLASGDAAAVLLPNKQLTGSTNWDAGVSMGLYKANSNGTLTFIPQWNVTGATASLNHCNHVAWVMGK